MKIRITNIKIGEGVYGDIMIAKSKSDGKVYAFKKFNGDENLECSTIREIATYAILMKVDSSQIAKVVGFKIRPKLVGITMDYATCCLQTWGIKEPEHLKREFPSITDKCIKSLATLHACDIVHGDIKPNNVLLWVKNGVVQKAVMADFGLSSSYPDRDTFAIYTPSYRAPEVWLRSDPSKASDVWALGISLVNVAHGDVSIMGLYNGRDMIRDKIVPYIEKHRKRLEEIAGKTYSDIIMSMLKWEKKDRMKMPKLAVKFPKRNWDVNRKDIIPTIKYMYKTVLEMKIRKESFVMACDIFIRFLKKRLRQSNVKEDEMKLYGMVSLTLATEWGELDSYRHHVSQLKLDQTKREIVLCLEGLLYIPDLPQIKGDPVEFILKCIESGFENDS